MGSNISEKNVLFPFLPLGTFPGSCSLSRLCYPIFPLPYLSPVFCPVTILQSANSLLPQIFQGHRMGGFGWGGNTTSFPLPIHPQSIMNELSLSQIFSCNLEFKRGNYDFMLPTPPPPQIKKGQIAWKRQPHPHPRQKKVSANRPNICQKICKPVYKNRLLSQNGKDNPTTKMFVLIGYG